VAGSPLTPAPGPDGGASDRVRTHAPLYGRRRRRYASSRAAFARTRAPCSAPPIPLKQSVPSVPAVSKTVFRPTTTVAYSGYALGRTWGVGTLSSSSTENPSCTKTRPRWLRCFSRRLLPRNLTSTTSVSVVPSRKRGQPPFGSPAHRARQDQRSSGDRPVAPVGCRRLTRSPRAPLPLRRPPIEPPRSECGRMSTLCGCPPGGIRERTANPLPR
jgi:hypothetical protein